jgi:hypothetical protein
VNSSGEAHDSLLGPPTPTLTDEDIAFLHHVWLDVSSHPGAKDAHHRDVVSVALEPLSERLAGEERAVLPDKFDVREWMPNGRAGASNEPERPQGSLRGQPIACTRLGE